MFTFFFTDIENSTKLWEEHGPAMAAALAAHDHILGEEIPRFGGRIVKHTGDGVFAVFEGNNAAAAALEIQRRLACEDWGAVGELRVRMALHAGSAEVRGGDYFGAAVNRAARLCEAAWGGQVLFTGKAAATAKFPPGATITALGVHLLKDLGEPEDVYQLSHAELPLREFPAIRSLSSRPHNLPPQATPFIGRAEELTALAALLRDPSARLLTLLGPGGIGKTRLALQAGAEVADDFEWGVYFVPLAAVSGPEYLVGAIADALRFSFYGARDAKGQLLNYIGEKNLLLLIDNFEHVISAKGLLGEILDGSPHVKVLVTSRERLKLHAERVYEVGGMDYPPAAAVSDPESFSAVRLFVESARRSRPSLSLTEKDWPSVHRICEAVGGVPLALELAASWARILPLGDIAAELEGSLELLETEAPDVPARHRSLRTVFDYSYELLSAEEKRALAALSAFRGGFTRDAARAVVGARLNTLAALVDKSLVQLAATGRYTLHEFIRQYAAEKLAEDNGAREATLKNYCGYYAGYLKEREGALAGGRQKEALEEIAGEIDNIRAAWRLLVERRDAAAITDAASALARFYTIRSLYEEGERAFGAAVEALSAAFTTLCDGDSVGCLALAKVVTRQGRYLALAGQFEKAKPLLARSIAIAKRLGDMPELTAALGALAAVAFYSQDIVRGQRIITAALNISRAIGDDLGVSSALLNLGVFKYSQDKYEEAGRLYRDAFDIVSAYNDVHRKAGLLCNLGNVEFALGRYSEAIKRYEGALTEARAIGNKNLTGLIFNNLGRLFFAKREFETARRYFTETIKIRKELNDRLELPYSYGFLAAVEAELGDYAAANELADEGLRVARHSGGKVQVATCLWAKGESLLGLGQYGEAAAALRKGFNEATAVNNKDMLVTIVISFSRLLLKRRKPKAAVEVAAAVLAKPINAVAESLASHMLDALKSEMTPAAFKAAAERGRAKDWQELAEEFM